MKYKGVLFDFDGTLVKSMEEHYKGWKYALSHFKKNLEPKELYVLEGQGVEKVGMQLLQKNNISIDHLDFVLKEKREYFEKHNNVQLYPGSVEVLKWLLKQGMLIGVVTGGDKKRVVSALKKFRVEKYFSAVITADDVKHTKPNPEPFEKGAQELNLLSKECIVIENAPLGIVSAKASGSYCVALENTLQKVNLQDADKVLSDYKELLEFLKTLLVI
ncbi:MAG: HAD family phosphatase [Calditrichia bacterium]|nr:HAD family phosphatase [Calditrichia bacterium]